MTIWLLIILTYAGNQRSIPLLESIEIRAFRTMEDCVKAPVEVTEAVQRWCEKAELR